jgi:hypothetical protein
MWEKLFSYYPPEVLSLMETLSFLFSLAILTLFPKFSFIVFDVQLPDCPRVFAWWCLQLRMAECPGRWSPAGASSFAVFTTLGAIERFWLPGSLLCPLSTESP